MRRILPLPLFIFIALFLPLAALPQLIKEEFTVQVFSDPFDEDRENWRNMSTSDNLFLVQDGEYLLRRKNTVSGYSIFPKWKNTSSAFSLLAGIKLDESNNEEAAVGLIFMAQEDASGAFIFEFNTKGQYRLKQLVGLSFRLLTGNVKKDGWVDSDVLNPTGQYNLVEIRTSKRNYDVYVNEKYLLSFTEIAYKTGDIGISIGAGTRARIDFITLKEPPSTPGKSAVPSASQTPDTTPASGSKISPSGGQRTGPAGSDQVIKLIEQVANLKVENQVLRDSLNLVKKQLKAATSTNPGAPGQQK